MQHNGRGKINAIFYNLDKRVREWGEFATSHNTGELLSPFFLLVPTYWVSEFVPDEALLLQGKDWQMLDSHAGLMLLEILILCQEEEKEPKELN